MGKRKKTTLLLRLQESWLIILLTMFAAGLFAGAIRKWDAIDKNTAKAKTLEENYTVIIIKLERLENDLKWLKEKNGYKTPNRSRRE